MNTAVAVVTLDWSEADAAYRKGQMSYVEFGQALDRLVKAGATQEEIAGRYDMSQPSVSTAIAVATDRRVLGYIASGKELPIGRKSLYLLTTLDDKGFEELAKPDTTRVQIEEYKRRLIPPLRQPVVPPKAATEGNILEQEEEQKDKPKKEVKPSYEKDLVWAFAYMGIQVNGDVMPRIAKGALDAIYKVLITKYQESMDASVDLNQAYQILISNAEWVR
jgi:hypothetical protein